MHLRYQWHIIEVVWLVLLKALTGRPTSIFILVTLSLDSSQHTSSSPPRQKLTGWGSHTTGPSFVRINSRVSYLAVRLAYQSRSLARWNNFLRALHQLWLCLNFKIGLSNDSLSNFGATKRSVLHWLWVLKGYGFSNPCLVTPATMTPIR